MLVIYDERVFLVPEETNKYKAVRELAEHLDEPVTSKYSVAYEPLEFRRTNKTTDRVRCLGPTQWNM